MIVMGIKAFGHDTGAAIVADNGSDLEIVTIAEARLNRIKHSWRYPFQSSCFEKSLSKSLPSEYDKDCDTVPAFNQVIHGLLLESAVVI